MIHSCASEITRRGIWLPSLNTINRHTCIKGENFSKLFIKNFSFPSLLVMFFLSLKSYQFIISFQIIFLIMILRQYLHQTWKFIFKISYVVITYFLWPILLIFPVRRRMKFAQTRWLHVTITTKTVKSFPILPTSFPNEMVWIHASIPVTKM